MKYLKIENNKGYYWDGSKYQEIDKINKKDLFTLLNIAESEDFEMDSYDESQLGNKAHQIIYENIYTKFEQFLGDKGQFKKEVDSLYKEAIGKYSAKIDDENEDIGEGVDDGGQEKANSDDVPF